MRIQKGWSGSLNAPIWTESHYLKVRVVDSTRQDTKYVVVETTEEMVVPVGAKLRVRRSDLV